MDKDTLDEYCQAYYATCAVILQTFSIPAELLTGPIRTTIFTPPLQKEDLENLRIAIEKSIWGLDFKL